MAQSKPGAATILANCTSATAPSRPALAAACPAVAQEEPAPEPAKPARSSARRLVVVAAALVVAGVLGARSIRTRRQERRA